MEQLIIKMLFFQINSLLKDNQLTADLEAISNRNISCYNANAGIVPPKCRVDHYVIGNSITI